MTRHRRGIVAKMCANFPTLINPHCIEHHEALVVGNAAKVFSEFQVLDCFANKIYEWVGRSTNRCNKLKELVKEVFEKDCVVVLQIHAVW